MLALAPGSGLFDSFAFQDSEDELEAAVNAAEAAKAQVIMVEKVVKPKGAEGMIKTKNPNAKSTNKSMKLSQMSDDVQVTLSRKEK